MYVTEAAARKQSILRLLLEVMVQLFLDPLLCVGHVAANRRAEPERAAPPPETNSTARGQQQHEQQAQQAHASSARIQERGASK